MKTFLQELAEKVSRDYPGLEGVAVVFPNQRAILYFKKHLSWLLEKPAFAPRIATIEDFISSQSNWRVPDTLELVHRLYHVYNDVLDESGKNREPEPFDQFYFWGEMLLRDFDEMDRHLVNARLLFRDLSNQKELDASFDFLTEEQKEFLRSFWGSFKGDLNENKKQFLHVWRLLPVVYQTFRERLEKDGLAYAGMVHRSAAERAPENAGSKTDKKIIFAGFNALTPAEEKIITSLVASGRAELIWDIDSYYVNNDSQEAGDFFRNHRRNKHFGPTFPKEIPTNFQENKKVQVIGTAQNIGQAKLMSQLVEEEISKGMNPEETLIVLPDEKMLLPVLHGVSGFVDHLNVTMGFSLANAPTFNLIEFLVELQQHYRDGFFNHKQVLSILAHPYVVSADPPLAHQTRKQILEKNQVSIPVKQVHDGPPLYAAIFRVSEGSFLTYAKEIIQEVGQLKIVTALDKEFAFHTLTLLNRMEQVESPIQATEDKSKYLRSFIRLFRQLSKGTRIPFTGEPLKGLQIMGVLETRNLDFKNVFVLSLNEGALPAYGNKPSYVPYNIRKAYSMPVTEQQDAIYAYLFYRVLQRAENIYLFYNTETDVLGQGEKSRFLQQLEVESGWKITPRVLHSPIQPNPILPITVEKTPAVLEALAKMNEGTERSKGISPSSLNSYINCSLQFFLQKVCRLKEPKEVEEELNPRIFGNIVHDVMERFYRRILDKKKSNIIQSTDFDQYKTPLEVILDQVFWKHYGDDEKSKTSFEGHRLVAREMARNFAVEIIEQDIAYTPFTIEGLEKSELLYYVPISNSPGQAVLSGKIDRIDRKDEIVRVIDYKTGTAKQEFISIESLFEKSENRNAPAFQTLLYTLLYKENYPSAGLKLVPGLITRSTLFGENDLRLSEKGKGPVENATELLEKEFKPRLKNLVEEIFDPSVPFTQTHITKTCEYCNFRDICYRSG